MGSTSTSPGSIYTWMRTANNASIASPSQRKKKIRKHDLTFQMHENVNFNKWDIVLTDVELPFAVAVKLLYVLVKLKTVFEWKLAKTA